MQVSFQTFRDPLRLGLQTAIAAAATYLTMTGLGWPQVSWAVISALFVVQQSKDGTLAAAIGRVGGAVIGSIVGLASVFIIGGEFATALRLAVSGLVMSALAGFWPGLRFGVVAAVVIALEPGTDVWGGALDRGIAIMIGALIGTASGFAIWAESARHRALRAARPALDSCADLLKITLDEAMNPHDRDFGQAHRRFLASVRTAHEMVDRVRLGQSDQPRLQEFVHALERLWHALIIIDRVVQGNPSRAPCPANLQASLRQVQSEGCAYLRSVSEHLRHRTVGPRSKHLDSMIDTVERLSDAQNSSALSGSNTETPDQASTSALIFGLREVGKNLREIDRILQ